MVKIKYMAMNLDMKSVLNLKKKKTMVQEMMWYWSRQCKGLLA